MRGLHVLIAHHDADARRLMQAAFERAGARVSVAGTGQEALLLLQRQPFDLVILAAVLPGMDGCQVCSQIGYLSDAPIIMVTGLDREAEVLRALDAGADDFLTSPVNLKELVLRARFVMGRVPAPQGREKPAGHYQDGYLTINLDERRVLVRGEPVRLSAKEYHLLTYMFLNAGLLLTVEQILQHVWGWNYQGNAAYVHTYVNRLRGKLEPDPKHPLYLLTEHGIGYRFEKQTPRRKQPERRADASNP